MPKIVKVVWNTLDPKKAKKDGGQSCFDFRVICLYKNRNAQPVFYASGGAAV